MVLTHYEARARVVESLGRQLSGSAAPPGDSSPPPAEPPAEPTLETAGGVPPSPPTPSNPA